MSSATDIVELLPDANSRSLRQHSGRDRASISSLSSTGECPRKQTIHTTAPLSFTSYTKPLPPRPSSPFSSNRAGTSVTFNPVLTDSYTDSRTRNHSLERNIAESLASSLFRSPLNLPLLLSRSRTRFRHLLRNRNAPPYQELSPSLLDRKNVPPRPSRPSLSSDHLVIHRSSRNSSLEFHRPDHPLLQVDNPVPRFPLQLHSLQEPSRIPILKRIVTKVKDRLKKSKEISPSSIHNPARPTTTRSNTSTLTLIRPLTIHPEDHRFPRVHRRLIHPELYQSR